MAKSAQVRNVTSRARKVTSSMREVRGVRSAAADRMSLAKAKSDGGMGLLYHGCGVRQVRLSRVLGRGCDRLALKDRKNLVARPVGDQPARSEERRVGKECRSRWS